ncbi:glycerophosphodiester phosphodiesterase [Pseudactinotalea suaedae]
MAPPNTIAAFESAWRAGADYLELDIQVTADGDAAVIHDATLEGTTSGVGPVAEHTAEQIVALDAGSSFSPVFAGEPVPMLSQVVDFLRSHVEIGLVLEIKGDWAHEPLQRALDLVDDPALVGRLVVESFSVETMTAARDLAPHLRRELLIDEAPEHLLGLCAELDVKGVGPDGRLLLQRPELVQVLHEAGLTVNVWTLNEPEHWAAATAIGVDGIVTDRPDRLAGWLSGRTMS